MASQPGQFEFFNYYNKYLWAASDFSNLQETIKLFSQACASGFRSCIVRGFDFFGAVGFGVQINPGMAISPDDYPLFKSLVTSGVIVGPSSPTQGRWTLIVARKTTSQVNTITDPANPTATVFLNTLEEAEIVAIDGAIGPNPSYPAKLSGDVILFGIRIPPAASGVIVDYIDYSISEYPKNQTDILKMYRNYDAIVGLGTYTTHRTFEELLADPNIANYKNILVKSSRVIDTPIVINQDNMRITFAPGVVYSKGTAGTAFSVTGEYVHFLFGEISGFNAGGNAGINFEVGADHGRIFNVKFTNNNASFNDFTGTAGEFFFNANVDTPVSGEVLTYNGSQFVNNPTASMNIFINGDMSYWLDGTSKTFSGTVTSGYVAIMYVYEAVSTGTVVISRDLTVPTDNDKQLYYSMKMECTVADASVAAADFASVSQFIRGFEYALVHNRTATFGSFFIANHTARYYICLQQVSGGGTRSYAFPIDVTSGWNFISHTLQMDGPGSWLFDRRKSIAARLVLMAGANYQVANPMEWKNNANGFAGADIGNFLGTLNNTLYWTGLMGVPGTAVQRFEQIRDQSALVELFYQKSMANETIFASGANQIQSGEYFYQGTSQTTAFARFVQFTRRMNNVTTGMVRYCDQLGNIGVVSYLGVSGSFNNGQTITIDHETERGFRYITDAVTAKHGVGFGWEARAAVIDSLIA